MWRKLIALLSGQSKQEPSTEIVCIPTSEKIPGLWPAKKTLDTRPNLDVLNTASTEGLMDLCDQYWNSFDKEAEWDGPVVRSSEVKNCAVRILMDRGPKVTKWAHARLKHHDYFAREDAASILCEQAKVGTLGSATDGIAEDLAKLAVRPWQDDTKEVQANSAALMALEVIGGPHCQRAIRDLLTSGNWDQDDIQHDAMCMLEKMTGQLFQSESSPILAAKSWVADNW
jgi:hypothetical protein